MLNMKKDMGGAASMLALAHMVMDRGMKVRLRLLIPAVENAISGAAFRPRDVYRSRKGLSVEIGNTDAEGRLILADAIALADEDEPDLIADMATLTGAARVALGTEIPPFYTDDDALAQALAGCATSENDPLWRMPLWRPYEALLESKVADVNNVSSGNFGGSITAALFLRRFVAAAKAWLHCDIYAWNQTGKPGRPEGAECQAARALYALLVSRYGCGKSLRSRRADGAAAPGALPRRATRHRGAQGRARDRLRDRGRLGARQARGRRLCGLPARERAARPRSGAHPQGRGAAHAGVPGAVDQAAAARGARARMPARSRTHRTAVRGHRLRRRRARAPSRFHRPAGKRLRGGRRAFPGRAVSLGRQDVARPRLFGPPPGRTDRVRYCLPARQRRAGAGARPRAFALNRAREVAARRPPVLATPRGHRARCGLARSRQCLPHGGRVRADRPGDRARSRRRQRGDEHASARRGGLLAQTHLCLDKK